MSPVVKLTKKQRKLDEEETLKAALQLKKVTPATDNQQIVFKNFYNKHLFLHGTAGTGKSFIALYLALKEILNPNSPYKKIIIVRSLVQTRNMGYLPGTEKEKSAIYEAPYDDICDELFEKPGCYKLLKDKGMIYFSSTSFIRGLTFNDAIIIADEVQNYNFEEASSVFTRVGVNSKLVVCGDAKQNDLYRSQYDQSGINKIMKVAQHMKQFCFVEFGPDDIQRSDFVKSWILACADLN